MKKILIILSTILILSSCQTPDTKAPIDALPTTNTEQKQTEAPKPTEEIKVTEVKPADKTASEGMTSVRKVDYDFFSTGKLDNLTLYTSAKKEEGEFMWDDMQSWLLELKTKDDKYYQLYSGNINLGNVYFDVTEIDGVLSILTYVHGSSELSVYKSTIVDGEIEQAELYSPKTDINNIYSSVPVYR